ncbi:hypothetical protein MHZ92_14960 [Sporosarcina sp. ACRSL]|nr:hypothetical protein [Sporosarcina sp. ACRSL]MCG7345435.1 hypothetical protein [Sporosarcina sp. ACRSL]
MFAAKYEFLKLTLRIEAEGGDSCERRYEERRLRVKAKRYEQDVAAE